MEDRVGGLRVSPDDPAVRFRRITLAVSVLAGVLAADCQTKVELAETYDALAGDVRLEIDPGLPATPPD